MKALVVYDSKFGNTKQIAEAIGDVFAERFAVQVLPAAEAAPLPKDIDLLVIGGPTHGHGMSEGMKALTAGIQDRALDGMPAAAFDTRYKMPRWLSGSAAQGIAKRLRRAGCREVLPPESFFVKRTAAGPLLPGELEEARAWARAVRAALPPVRLPVCST